MIVVLVVLVKLMDGLTEFADQIDCEGIARSASRGRPEELSGQNGHVNPIFKFSSLSKTSEHCTMPRHHASTVKAQPLRTKNNRRDLHNAMESNQLPLGQVILNETYMSNLGEDNMPAFLSKCTADIWLPLQWVTDGPPRFTYQEMSEIAQLVMQVHGNESTEDFVDISDVKVVSLEEIKKNTRILAPEKDNAYGAKEVVFVSQRSLGAVDPGKVFNPWNKWSGERRGTCKPFPLSWDKPRDFSIAKLGGRVNLEFLLKLECTRSKSQTKAKLTIPRMDIGMETTCLKCSLRNRKCERNCGEMFIHKVQITVSPDTWAQNCGELEPIAAPTEFTIQSTNGHTVQVPIFNPKHASYAFQNSKTVSHSSRSFELEPASRGFSSKAVNWIWEFKRFPNGTKLDYNTRLGSNVPLGINPAFIQIREKVSASWDGSHNVDLRQLQQNWHMTIIVQTAVVKGCRFLPGSQVKEGVTIAFSQGGLTFV